MKQNNFTEKCEGLFLSTDFKMLQNKLSFKEPNFWQILGVARKETLVTKFLAWLLNPSANHTFQSQFLKMFLIAVVKESNSNKPIISPIEIDILNLSSAKTIAEYPFENRRCDIVIECEECSFICIIENKIGAKETKDQTEDYYNKSFDNFPNERFRRRLYIFLSPQGAPAKNINFINISYNLLINTIKEFELHHNGSDAEKFLLKQFRENLRGNIEMDKETIDLAQSLYEKHKDIIEFIYQNSEKPESLDVDSEWDNKSWFLNIGETGDEPYSWEDCKTYSFVCAGGGKRYRTIIEKFKVGDIIYAYVSKIGYVGVGEVLKKAIPIKDAKLDDERNLIDLPLIGKYNSTADEDDCDWVAFVKWEISKDKKNAARFNPIVPSTASKIYEHRKPLLKKIIKSLKT